MIEPNSQVDFFEWQSPECLRDNAELVRSQLGAMSMRGPGKDFREAYVAARFATFRHADLVRLIPPRERERIPTPDFAVRIGATELWFETTEADRPRRKRGNEDHSPIDKPQRIPDSHWVEPESYQRLVQQRTRSKAAKKYDKCDGLIIWSNAFPRANEDHLTLDWWRIACLPARNAFPEVWVHTSCETVDVFQRLF